MLMCFCKKEYLALELHPGLLPDWVWFVVCSDSLMLFFWTCLVCTEPKLIDQMLVLAISCPLTFRERLHAADHASLCLLCPYPVQVCCARAVWGRGSGSPCPSHRLAPESLILAFTLSNHHSPRLQVSFVFHLFSFVGKYTEHSLLF